MTELSVKDASKLKVAELKAELTRRGLDTSGLKNDLYNRLKEDIESKERQTSGGDDQDKTKDKEDAAASPSVAAKNTASPANKAASIKKASPVKKADESPAKKAANKPVVDAEMPLVSLIDEGKDEIDYEDDSSPEDQKESDVNKDKHEKEKEAAPSRPKVSAVDREMDTGRQDRGLKRGRDSNGDNYEENKRGKWSNRNSGAGEEERKAAPEVEEGKWTDALSVVNFVRPFTNGQLKELLGSYGSVEDMWLNQIKSHCIVRFASPSEAEKARVGLFDLKWPERTGRRLLPEFTTREKLEEHKEGNISAEQRAREAVLRSVEERRRAGGGGTSSGTGNRPVAQPAEPSRKVVSLDELFRKTTTKPPIYYLPLTVEEVQQKKNGASTR